MKTFILDANGQSLNYDSAQILASGQREYIQFEYNFDSAWDNTTKFATFFLPGGGYREVEFMGNICLVPFEVTQYAGCFRTGLYGVNGSSIITTNLVTFVVQPNIWPYYPPHPPHPHGIPDAPFDGNLYGRKNGLWEIIPPSETTGGTVKWFATTTDRDNYYTANPTELISGISVGVGNPVDAYTYDGTQWLLGALAFKGDKGDDGIDGVDGIGIPQGGTTGQVLSKKTATDYDTEWVNPSGGISDVEVDGTSVVNPNGVAEIDTSNFGTVKDVEDSSGNSLVDGNGVAVIPDSTGDALLLDFQPYHNYLKDEPTVNGGVLYRAKTDFTSGASFDGNDWQAISKADLADYVKLTSATTQEIDSDIALAEGKSLYLTDSNGTEHTGIKHAEYTGANPGQQTEIGSEVDAICLNYNALGWDGTPQPQGDNPLVNYKDTTGVTKVDWLTLYNKDLQPLLNRMASFEMAGVQVGHFNTYADVPTTLSSALWNKTPTINDFFTIQADENEGGAHSRYWVDSVDETNDTFTVQFNGTFESTAPAIFITAFNVATLATSIPDDGRPYDIYWAAATTAAPSVSTGFGTIVRYGNYYVVAAHDYEQDVYAGYFNGTVMNWDKVMRASDLIDYALAQDLTNLENAAVKHQVSTTLTVDASDLQTTLYELDLYLDGDVIINVTGSSSTDVIVPAFVGVGKLQIIGTGNSVEIAGRLTNYAKQLWLTSAQVALYYGESGSGNYLDSNVRVVGSVNIQGASLSYYELGCSIGGTLQVFGNAYGMIFGAGFSCTNLDIRGILVIRSNVGTGAITGTVTTVGEIIDNRVGTSNISTHAKRSTDFVTAITNTNKGLTRADAQAQPYPLVVFATTDYVTQIMTKVKEATGIVATGATVYFRCVGTNLGLPNANTYLVRMGLESTNSVVLEATDLTTKIAYAVTGEYASTTTKPVWINAGVGAGFIPTKEDSRTINGYKRVYLPNSNNIIIDMSPDIQRSVVNRSETSNALGRCVFNNVIYTFPAGGGIISKSSDNGFSWQDGAVSPGTGNNFRAFTIGTKIVLISADVGTPVYESTDGTTWTAAGTPTNTTPLTTVCLTNTGRLIACNADGTEVTTSDDGGATWAVGTTLPAPTDGGSYNFSCQITNNPTYPTRICFVTQKSYAAAPANTGDVTVSYSDDDGVTWTRGPNAPGTYKNGQCVLCKSNGTLWAVLVGSGQVQRKSLDGGATWVAAANAGQNNSANSNGMWIADGTPLGIMLIRNGNAETTRVSTDGGTTWQDGPVLSNAIPYSNGPDNDAIFINDSTIKFFTGATTWLLGTEKVVSLNQQPNINGLLPFVTFGATDFYNEFLAYWQSVAKNTGEAVMFNASAISLGIDATNTYYTVNMVYNPVPGNVWLTAQNYYGKAYVANLYNSTTAKPTWQRLYDGSAFIPDYANMENVNRITAKGGSWTVQKDGFVLVYATSSHATNSNIQFYINGIAINGSSVAGGNSNSMRQILLVKAGDIVLINGNDTMTAIACYFIPPLATISHEATEYAWLPDYANKETTNRLPNASSTWTATQDGFVYVQTLGGTGGFTINGQVAFALGVSSSSVISGTTLQIAAGDTIAITGTLGDLACYFIPPKAIIPSTLNLNISNTETLTGKTYNGVPTYTRRFAGTITIGAATDINTPLLGVGSVTHIVAYGGEWLGDNNNTFMLGNGQVSRASTVYRSSNGALYFYSLCPTARTNAAYDIWVEYTKA